jgi:transcriptional regulator with XRE-family HTH domain
MENFRHPLRVLRESAFSVKKSRAKFAKMFGVSESSIEKIEAGERNLGPDLADAIMLRYGIDGESLKQERGFPRSLLIDVPATAGFSIGRDLDEVREAEKKYRELLKLRDKHKRLQRSIEFWQKYVVTSGWNHWIVADVLITKVWLLLATAKQTDKFYAVAVRLSRWIDDAVEEFRLRKRINELMESAVWPSFMDTLGTSFWLRQKRSGRFRPFTGEWAKEGLRKAKALQRSPLQPLRHKR